MDGIPRNAGGKVLKVRLRAMESGSGKEGENLMGRKKEDPTAEREGSADGWATEGERFNEKTTAGIHADSIRE